MGFFDRLFRRTDPRDVRIAELRAYALADAELLLTKKRAGEAITEAEYAAAQLACKSYGDALSEKHGANDLNVYSESDRADYYHYVIRLVVIGHPNHGAWPVFASVRHHVSAELLRRRAAGSDPFLELALVNVALLHGDVELARECHERLKGDRFLQGFAERWADYAIQAFPRTNDVEAARAFLAAVRPRDPWDEVVRRYPSERRWILLATAGPTLPIDERATLADARDPAACRAELAADWDVRDTAEARKTLRWLLERGHSARLENELRDPEAIGDEARRTFVLANRDALARGLIHAWDQGRAVEVARASHRAGFLDEAETWEWLAAAGDQILADYDSWTGFGEDYLLGAAYFRPGEPDSWFMSSLRWLLADPRSPWKSVPFGGAWPPVPERS